MTSNTKKRADRGFTLVEVLVALAIASGALILILSANNASLRRSVKSRLLERVQRAAESKFSEWRAGVERASEGPLQGFEAYRWEVHTTAESTGALKRLSRVTFSVGTPDGRILEWIQFH